MRLNGDSKKRNHQHTLQAETVSMCSWIYWTSLDNLEPPKSRRHAWISLSIGIRFQPSASPWMTNYKTRTQEPIHNIAANSNESRYRKKWELEITIIRGGRLRDAMPPRMYDGTRRTDWNKNPRRNQTTERERKPLEGRHQHSAAALVKTLPPAAASCPSSASLPGLLPFYMASGFLLLTPPQLDGSDGRESLI